MFGATSGLHTLLYTLITSCFRQPGVSWKTSVLELRRLIVSGTTGTSTLP